MWECLARRPRVSNWIVSCGMPGVGKWTPWSVGVSTGLRSTKHLLDALEEFKSLGIAFVSHQEAIDTTSPMGKLLFTIVAAMAEMERSILIERVRAGMATAKSKGQSLGRPKRIFRRDIALEMRVAGKSWREIGRTLRVPVSTIREACAERLAKAEAKN
jgi:DNA invertase Pin-like site-specific DNA recombinase